jgi:hypothetical protein
MSIPLLRRSAVVLLILALTAPCARGEILQAGASRDNTIFQNNPDNSLGGGVTFYAGKNSSQNSPRRGLIAFDLSGIPLGSTVNSVRLDLVLADVSGGETSPTRTTAIHKVLADWGDGTSGWGLGPGGTGQGIAPPFPAGETPATWRYQFYNTTEWSPAGGSFVATASASTLVGNTRGTTYSWTSADMLADVQGWVNQPAGNFGWAIVGDEGASGTFRTFWSKEAYLVGARTPPLPTGWFTGCEPKLVVDYTAVPEPSYLAVLAGGALALLTLRRLRRR